MHTERGTVTMMQNAPKAMSVETITEEISGIRRNQILTAVFQVTLFLGQQNETADENVNITNF